MKKTLTVNLGGTIFNIDEDAYQLLDKYLSNLRIHFHKEEGSDEIMDDFEMRISELLNDKVRLGHNVITIEHIEEIITRMGKPEELFEEEQSDTNDEKSKFSNADFHSNKEQAPTKKRLFRDPDDKILGGVAGGFASYMGWDVTAIRVALLLLLFLTHGVIAPVYLVLWLIIPPAKTASEKLEMRGESITLENIGKTVTSGFEKVTDGVHDYVKSDKPRNIIQKLADVLVQIIGIILKLGFIIIAIIFAPVLLLLLFIFIVVICALIFGGGGLLYHLIPSVNWMMIADYPEIPLILGSIGCVLSLGIPLATVLYSVCSQIFKFKPITSGVKWTLLALWIIGVIVGIACGTYIGVNSWSNIRW